MEGGDNKGKKPIRGDPSTNDQNKGKRKRFQGNQNKSGAPNKKPTYGGERPDGVPGASKLKASIRQAKRLLAKPNLAPGTKIEAERRLASLNADLNKLERSRVEKNRALKYHKVKFFERQKLLRKIKKSKKLLAKLEKKLGKESDSSNDESDREGSDSDDQGEQSSQTLEEVQKHLTEYRVLLHYVLHYPSELRYVSLFPESVKEPQPPTKAEKDKTRAKAFEVLEKVRKRINSGDLSIEPEAELEQGGRDRNSTIKSKEPKKDTSAKKGSNNDADTSDSDSEADQRGLHGDDFFAQGSGDDDDDEDDD